jgi:HPt (histidine-containing phosphotransfer) domain-containing protein
MTGEPSTAPLRGVEDDDGRRVRRELVDTFLVEAPRMLADLRAAHAAGDAPRFRRAAHSLKSNANTFGAQRFAAMAKDLELGGVASAGQCSALDALTAEFAASRQR